MAILCPKCYALNMDSEQSIFIEGAIKEKDVAEYLENRAKVALDKFLTKKQEPS